MGLLSIRLIAMRDEFAGFGWGVWRGHSWLQRPDSSGRFSRYRCSIRKMPRRVSAQQARVPAPRRTRMYVDAIATRFAVCRNVGRTPSSVPRGHPDPLVGLWMALGA